MSIDFKSSDIQELMSKLNTEGKITDKETAIKLLIITPKAWKLLSKELKNDKEVMLYYQPEGYIELEEGPTVGAYLPLKAALYCDKNFVIDANVSVLEYACIKVHSFIPKCVLRKGNNFVKAYISVQERMKTTKGKIQKETSRDELIEKTKDMDFVDYCSPYKVVGQTDGYHRLITEYTYDRTDLDEIVTDEYQKYLSK